MKANNTFTGNVGEWSEVYVLLKLLGDGCLHSANSEFNPDFDLFFPIVKVNRNERSGKQVEFSIDHIDERVSVNINGIPEKEIPKKIFAQEAAGLLDEMRSSHKTPAFPACRTEHFITNLGCESIKASSSDKTDITIQVHDPQTGYESICGFSIKSQIGSPSTLLNATQATNFTFKVNGLKKDDTERINKINGSRKIINRMEAIFQESRSVIFQGVDNPTFARNLLLIDSRMDEILAEALIIHYRDNVKSVLGVIEILEEDNPLDFPASGFYRYKMKKFLCAVALGLQPSSEWDGKDEANGGYIIVTENGKVIAYHIYNRDQFEEYLLASTHFERGSTNRHNFASLYEENTGNYIKLNLQIRF